MEKKTPKQFALDAIKPYYKNPLICGVNNTGICVNITSDGKKCVFGQFLTCPVKFNSRTARNILESYPEDEILVPEAINILTIDQWEDLQILHDKIAIKKDIKASIEKLGLFTLEELQVENTVIV